MTKMLTKAIIDTAYDNYNIFVDTIAKKKKYYQAERNETSLDDVMQRIYNETDKMNLWDAEEGTDILSMLQERKFIPAGSILCGLGNDTCNMSLSNCYLTKINNDSIEEIFDANKRLGRTYSYRGGSGIDITVLRPTHSVVNNAAITSSGAVSFMPLFNSTTEIIGQAGRRGALIITLDIRHPDTPKFIRCKADPKKVFGVDNLTGNTQNVDNANISLKVTEPFMQAVVNNDTWDFIFPSFNMLSGKVFNNKNNEQCINVDTDVYRTINEYMIDNVKSLYIQFKDSSTNSNVLLKDGNIIFDKLSIKSGMIDFTLGTRPTPDTFKPLSIVYNALWDGDYDKWQQQYGLPVEIYDTVPAQDVFNQIAEASHMIGDPGILFIDTVQRLTPGTAIDPKRLKPMGVNPCGEQSLPYNGNCLLGSQVWHKYVSEPYTPSASFDTQQFLKDTRLQVLLLNAVHEINIEKHPLLEQREMDQYSKRIGIELTGLGDTLAMMGMLYGSDESVVFIEELCREKAIVEITTSLELAAQFGCAPAFDDVEARKRFLNCDYIKHLELDDELMKDIVCYGLYNTAFNSIGPTGSISMMVGNCTSGIEPLYKFNYTLKTRINDDVNEILHGPVVEWLRNTDSVNQYKDYTLEQLKDKLHYVEAHDLDYHKRIKVQAALQRYCDTSISSTINLPRDATVDDIQNIYFEAWKNNLKGITVFRDGCKEGVYGSVDTCDESKKTSVVSEHIPVERKLLDIEDAQRFRVNWHNGKVYIIVSLDNGNPVEIFAKIPRECGVGKDGNYNERLFHENQSLVDALSRNISLSLRYQLPLELVVKQLDKSSHAMVDMPGIFARILRRYLGNKTNGKDYKTSNCLVGQVCPECGESTYVLESGCGSCKSCSYSKCG